MKWNEMKWNEMKWNEMRKVQKNFPSVGVAQYLAKDRSSLYVTKTCVVGIKLYLVCDIIEPLIISFHFTEMILSMIRIRLHV